MYLLRSCYLTCISQDGRTPLYWAIRGGHLDTLKVLLAAGAPVDAKNKVGLCC